jgi:shikimate kinase
MSGGVPRRAVILVGFMGAGKSSVGRALAQRLGWTFEDLDERVELRTGKTVAEIFRECGEAEFRRVEQEQLEELLQEVRGGSKKVIALGGGAFAQAGCAELIRAEELPSVFLDAKVEELWERCTRQAKGQGWQRPLLQSAEGFRELYEKRRPYYLKAGLRHETGGKMVEEIARELADWLNLPAG